MLELEDVEVSVMGFNVYVNAVIISLVVMYVKYTVSLVGM